MVNLTCFSRYDQLCLNLAVTKNGLFTCGFHQFQVFQGFVSMASPQPSLAAPLHVQHLQKALRLDPFLGYLEGVFTDPYSTNIR